MSRTIRVLSALCFLASTMLAQEFRATITGRVLDPSGAAVPNVSIRAVNAANNETSTATSDSAGAYTIPFLRPGVYKLTATAQGFKVVNRENVTLQVSQIAGIDIALEVGAVTDTVNVTGEAALALVAGMMADDGDPAAANSLERSGNRIAAVVAYFPPTDLVALSATQLADVSTAFVQALTTAQVAALTVSQIKALDATKLKALDTADVVVLGTDRVAALSATQVGGLNTTQVSTLTTDQVGALTATQAKARAGRCNCAPSPGPLPASAASWLRVRAISSSRLSS